MTSAGRWRAGRWPDVCLAVLIGLASATVAFEHVLPHYMPNASDEDTFRLVSARVAPYREDLLYPCHRRFGFMAQPEALVRLDAWRAFITRKTDAFPCAALAAVPIVPVAYNYTLHSNLHRALTWVFVLTGPKLSGFAYYQAVQYGLFLALLFGIFRLGMGRVVSALAMLPLAVSPRHLEIAIAPIEYAKAPFFAACLLGVAALVTIRMSAGLAYSVAAATGLAVGIGFGVKPDVLVFAPFAVIVIAVFVRSGERGPVAARWRLIAAYTIALAVAGAPSIRAHFFGPDKSLLPIQILGGMAPAFVQEYVQPPIYDYGVMFDDDHVIAVINSYHQRVNGSREFGPFFSTVIQHGATDLLFRLQRTFAADLLLRTYAAILAVFQFMPYGAVVALLVLAGLCRVDMRLLLFVLFTLLYMVGYVSLVFAPKHYFHLEFVPWWFAGCLVSFAAGTLWQRARGLSPPPALRHSWGTVAIAIVSFVVLAGGSLALARAYQDQQVRPLLEGYADETGVEHLSVRSLPTAAAGQLIIPEGVAIDSREVTAADFVFDSPLVQTDYLMLRVQCVSDATGTVSVVYRRPAHWRDSLDVPCARAAQAWTVMWPVYQHAPHQIFEGFELSGAATLRLEWIGQNRSLERYPLMLRLRLPDDWRQRPMHHVLNVDAVSPARVRSAPAALSFPPPPLPPPAVSWDPPFVAGLQPLATEAPRLDSWSPLTGVSVSGEPGNFVVAGNSSTFGYQLSSPSIAVTPHSRLAVRVYGTVDQGRVALGILAGDGQQWLMPAVWDRSDFVVNTEGNDQLYFIFANYRLPSDPSITSRFTVRSVSYDIEDSLLDRLRIWLWPTH